jgi:hypothetical protein
MSKIALSPNASGTGTFTVAAPNTNTDYTLTLPQGTGTVVANNVNSAIVSGTAVASTSGTSIDFTGIPSWVKRITVMFDGVSTNGTSNFWMRIGDSGGIETTGYLGGVSNISTSVTVATTTNAFVLDFSVGANNVNTGHAILTNISGNTWVCSSLLNNTATGVTKTQAGTKTLSDVLTQLIITTANGTDTFDAGSINIFYE